MDNYIRKTYAGLDIGKFLCAFLILFYHYFSEHGPVPRILDEVLSLYAVAVALFMAISGFLVFDKLRLIDGTPQKWAVVRKQALRILTIYAIWSIPYLIYTICRWDWGTITPSFVAWQIQGWIFKSTFYTIWFMPMLAIGLILSFWLVVKLPIWLVEILAFLCYIAGSLTLTYKYFGVMIPGFSMIMSFAETWLGGARGWLFFAFPLIMIGRRMAENTKRKSWLFYAILSIISIGALLAEALLLRQIAGHTGIDMTIMMVPSVYFILGFLISIKIPTGSYCVWMRKMSTLIFMSQRLFLTVIPVCFPVLIDIANNKNIIGMIIMCGPVLILSILIIGLSDRFKWMKLLY